MRAGLFLCNTMANLSTERISFEAALANLLALYEISGGEGTILETRLTLINLTKAKLDEVIPEGEGLQFTVEDDINISDPLNLLINAILDEAGTRVLMNCPKHYLDPVKSTATATANNADPKIGYIVLPDNFLRFISLKMTEWLRPVTELTPVESPVYAMQFNRYARGGIGKPKAAMAHRPVSVTAGEPPVTTTTQKRVIEYFSVKTSHAIDWLYYIQETEAENIQTNLRHALTWMAAGMILQITERVDLAKVAFEQEQACYKNL